MQAVSSEPPQGPSPSLRGLFAGLIDDAAVFPPRAATLSDAVRGHADLIQGPHADLVGPLLLAVDSAAQATALLSSAPRQLVVLIARPGVAPEQLATALRLFDESGLPVAGIELGWTPGWRDVPAGGRPVVLEIPRGDSQRTALTDAGAAAAVDGRIRAKFRTGVTPTWPWPDEAELGAFMHAAHALRLPFKLTGGLHHLVRGEHDGEPQHGLLNVLNAVVEVVKGAPASVAAGILAERDRTALVSRIARLDIAAIAGVRGLFTSFGCCDVRDPIDELVAVGLVASA
jgi:hypothetical protein